MPLEAKWAAMASFTYTPISLNLRLPEASRSSLFSAKNFWPAPSATTITACFLSDRRFSSAANNPPGPSKVEINFGNQHKINILLGQNGGCGNKACVAAHQFY